jgi:CDP-diacylglycerol--glycerol-3-phosphate 3-phosphatidyltransferase
MPSFHEIRKKAQTSITAPLIPIIKKLRLSPDMLTFIGIFLNLIAAFIIGSGHLFIGGLIFLLAGLFDMLDGVMARFLNQATKFGALLDSTSDRLTEAAVFLSLIFITSTSIWPYNTTMQLVLIFLALTGSFLTSYIRARAEGLQIDCSVGLFTRPERVIILALGLLLNLVFLALSLVVILSFITVGQRFFHVWRRSKTL